MYVRAEMKGRGDVVKVKSLYQDFQDVARRSSLGCSRMKPARHSRAGGKIAWKTDDDYDDYDDLQGCDKLSGNVCAVRSA